MESHIRCPAELALGPTLFLIYINNLVTHIQSTARLSPDDCLICRPVSTPASHQILQEDSTKPSEWVIEWEMKFNTNKCCIMELSN